MKKWLRKIDICKSFWSRKSLMSFLPLWILKNDGIYKVKIIYLCLLPKDLSIANPTRGQSCSHVLWRKNIVILDMSTFYDIIVKIWRRDDVTSIFYANRNLFWTIIIRIIKDILKFFLAHFNRIKFHRNNTPNDLEMHGRVEIKGTWLEL